MSTIIHNFLLQIINRFDNVKYDTWNLPPRQAPFYYPLSSA